MEQPDEASPEDDGADPHLSGPPRFVTPAAYLPLQLLMARREHAVDGPTCRCCRSLGALTWVTDVRGARRVRRRCPRHPLGFTDLDWPVCPRFEEKG
jgi:hypothetical protein